MCIWGSLNPNEPAYNVSTAMVSVSSSDVKLKCLGTRLNHPEGAFIRPLEWGTVGNPPDEHKLSLPEVVRQCMDAGSHGRMWERSRVYVQVVS